MTELVLKIVLAEYDQIKNEQRARIQHRDGLVYTVLTALGALAVGALQLHAPAILLVSPWVALILGWKYLANDEKISAAGWYVQNTLAPQLEAAAGLSPNTLLGWETAHRVGIFRPARRYAQCAVDLATFCLLPGASLVAALVVKPVTGWYIVAAAVEGTLLGVLSGLIRATCRAPATGGA